MLNAVVVSAHQPGNTALLLPNTDAVETHASQCHTPRSHIASTFPFTVRPHTRASQPFQQFQIFCVENTKQSAPRIIYKSPQCCCCCVSVLPPPPPPPPPTPMSSSHARLVPVYNDVPFWQPPRLNNAARPAIEIFSFDEARCSHWV
jgi:hypothetical protein